MKHTILTIALAIGLTACQSVSTQTAQRIEARVVTDVCDSFTQQSYDGELDTRETIVQIKDFNAKRNAFCASQGDTK